jgi:hypothetical protein
MLSSLFYSTFIVVAERGGNLNIHSCSRLRAERKSESTHRQPSQHTLPTVTPQQERIGRRCFIIVSAEDNNTMCSDIGTTSRVCAAYSFTGILFTVSVVRLASLPDFCWIMIALDLPWRVLYRRCDGPSWVALGSRDTR